VGEEARQSGWWFNPLTDLKQLDIRHEPFKCRYDILDEAGQVVLAANTPLDSGTVFQVKVGRR
jgi:hypothetical protein